MMNENNAQLREEIIACAKKFGADLVGFGGIERFAGEEVSNIFPETKTVIALAFRVLRGTRRGIEEGTTYYQYTTNGVETLEETVMPMALLQVNNVLEDAGYTAVPQKKNQLIMQAESDTNPEMNHEGIYRGRDAEHQMDFDRAAVLCGLGEKGLSGTLLTDDFGPFQRYCFILTDAELEETPLVVPHLCDNCGECIKACPGHAIDENGVKDNWQCAAYYRGANMTKNPFMDPKAYADLPNRHEIMAGEADLDMEAAIAILSRTYFYPQVKHGYVSSICGRACDTACYVHLEEKGVLTRKFVSNFRRRPEWHLPMIDEEIK